MEKITTDVYRTTDGEIFMSEQEAIKHQEGLPTKSKGDLLLELSILEDRIAEDQKTISQIKNELSKFISSSEKEFKQIQDALDKRESDRNEYRRRTSGGGVGGEGGDCDHDRAF